MENYEREILGIFDTVLENADQEIREKAYDIYVEHINSVSIGPDDDLEQDFEDYFMSLKSFVYKLHSDQLIAQGVSPRDIPLKSMTSANTGMSVPVGEG